jgi:transcription initiation factor IIF auxiliary subunit
MIKDHKFGDYHFRLSISKVSDDWYEWGLGLNESSDRLDKIERVEYILHPTYKNRIRVIDNPKDGFLLEFAGYDGFNMPVNIYLKKLDQNGDNEEFNVILPVVTK